MAAAFDFNNRLLVLSGTIYGEASGCGQDAMENVAQCILNRASAGWSGGDIRAVCLAHLQFSCWNANDPNRTRIMAAAARGKDPAWVLACAVATRAIAQDNPDRINGADSYFARSMAKPPFWAHPPAVERYADQWHNFWRVHPVQNAPSISVISAADALNQAQLDTIAKA